MLLVLTLMPMGASKGEEEITAPTPSAELPQALSADKLGAGGAEEETRGTAMDMDAPQPAMAEDTERATVPQEAPMPTVIGDAEKTAAPGETPRPSGAVETPGPDVSGEITPPDAPEDAGAKPVMEYSDPSTPIEAALGEEFAISLDSNPTTGYDWRIAGKVDERVVRLSGTRFVPPDSELKGAPGMRLWTFKGAGHGETTLSFEYLRPWEKKPPIRKAAFTVIVR